MAGANRDPRFPHEILIRGGGVAGTVAAICLAERARAAGHVLRITLADPAAPGPGRGASWLAGGMLAPWCEAEAAGPGLDLAALGPGAIDWWTRHLPQTVRAGSLVLALSRDAAELDGFARRVSGAAGGLGGGGRVDADRIAALEPDLAGRFPRGLFFPNEAHLDPRAAMAALRERLAALDVAVVADAAAGPAALEVDCRGIAARDSVPGLRGVRGEMLLLRCPGLRLQRPVRLLHPRFPLYVVPRADHVFMVGATMIEGGRDGPATARSVVELLNAAYALHPGFAEAEILEIGAGLRPAFDDNIPALHRTPRGFALNGMFRHGFLLGPVLGERLAGAVFGDVASDLATLEVSA